MKAALLTKGLISIAVTFTGAFAQAQTIFVDSFSTDFPEQSNPAEVQGVADGIGGERAISAYAPSNGGNTAVWKIENGAFDANTFGPGDIFFRYQEQGIGNPPQFGTEEDYSDLYITLELGAGSQAGVLSFSQSERLTGLGVPVRSLSLHYYNLPAVSEPTTIQLGPAPLFTDRGFPVGFSAPQWRDSYTTDPSSISAGRVERFNSFRFQPGIQFNGVGQGTIFSDLPSNVETGRLVVNSVTLTPIPEPGTMVALAAAGAFFLRRRRSA
jgi:hypothetical protein